LFLRETVAALDEGDPRIETLDELIADACSLEVVRWAFRNAVGGVQAMAKGEATEEQARAAYSVLIQACATAAQDCEPLDLERLAVVLGVRP
jgi:hypothetical protein